MKKTDGRNERTESAPPHGSGARLSPASAGKGPLLQRDYWAVFEDSPLRPRALIDAVAERFCEFPPEELVHFEPAAPGVASGCLLVGEDLAIRIRGAGECGVRVVHRDDNSFTLLTLEGHPEAGRITFGAYPNDEGDVVFHIRSRARASSSLRYVEFLALGDAMQTNTWADFINNVAATIGCEPEEIHADTIEVEESEADTIEKHDQPTFLARGD